MYFLKTTNLQENQGKHAILQGNTVILRYVPASPADRKSAKVSFFTEFFLQCTLSIFMILPLKLYIVCQKPLNSLRNAVLTSQYRVGPVS